MTVERTYPLATSGLDAHATYVAMSRHCMATSIHYGRDDFSDERDLRTTLARERPKDMASDYADSARERSDAGVRPGRGGDAAQNSGAVPAAAPGVQKQSDHAASLRAAFAALANAPSRTAEQARAAFSAAGKAASDSGVERGKGYDKGAGL